MTFTVSSNSFKDGDYLAMTHVASADAGFWLCRRETNRRISKWSGAPAGTKSFAVTCYDPDAPTGSGFWHWLVVNIPANVTELSLGAGSKGGAMPPGSLQTRTDYGFAGYGGPCPPEGDHPHRYLFTRVCGRRRKPAGESRYARSADRLQPAFQHAGESRHHGPVQAANAGARYSAVFARHGSSTAWFLSSRR